jgi:hypothetical protein
MFLLKPFFLFLDFLGNNTHPPPLPSPPVSPTPPLSPPQLPPPVPYYCEASVAEFCPNNAPMLQRVLLGALSFLVVITLSNKIQFWTQTGARQTNHGSVLGITRVLDAILSQALFDVTVALVSLKLIFDEPDSTDMLLNAMALQFLTTFDDETKATFFTPTRKFETEKMITQLGNTHISPFLGKVMTIVGSVFQNVLFVYFPWIGVYYFLIAANLVILDIFAPVLHSKVISFVLPFPFYNYFHEEESLHEEESHTVTDNLYYFANTILLALIVIAYFFNQSQQDVAKATGVTIVALTMSIAVLFMFYGPLCK